MSITLAIAVYIVIWWTVLFAVLPIGVRTQDEDGAIVPGTPGSAPTAPRLLRVVGITTAVATALFVLSWVVVRYWLPDLQVWIACLTRGPCAGW